MIEKESEWILPENLKKQEEQQKRDAENGIYDGETDFGSYYAYLNDVNYDYIKLHAISDDQKSFEYVKHISYFLVKRNVTLEGNIIDLGCAVGTITNAIGKLNKDGTTCGLDISEAGIEVARRRYPDCNFYCQSADNLDNFDNECFDVIHAREFYPFTRTNDVHYHLEYLKKFHSKLKPHGFVLLQMVALSKGFCNTWQGISKNLNEIGYAGIHRYEMLPRRVFNLLGRFSCTKLFYPILLFVYPLLHWIVRLKGGTLEYLYILPKK